MLDKQLFPAINCQMPIINIFVTKAKKGIIFK